MKVLVLFAYLGWGLAILYLSLTGSPPQLLPEVLSWDKLLHAMAYASLTLLGGLTLSLSMADPKKAWRMACGISLIYGALLETLQGLMTSTRMAQAGDMVANAVGALLVTLPALLILRRRQS